jgi:DNA-binding CsgD family transcriptional regulator
MSTGRVSLRDMRAVLRVVGECRELGADPGAWHAHLLSSLCGLAGARVGIGANLRHFTRGRTPEGISIHRTGWPDAAAERAWQEYVTTVPVQRTPEYARLVGFKGPIVTRTRPQLWDDASWYRSSIFNDYHRASWIDHYIFSILRHRRPGAKEGGEGGEGEALYNSVWIHRPVGEPAFSRREWWLVRLVHAEIGGLIGTSLAVPGTPGPGDLTPRPRQTLDALLDGDSEKQIASRLGLSQATVHEYVTAVYRHFGAASRGELLARFIGRARPSSVLPSSPLPPPPAPRQARRPAGPDPAV